jgi:hypothetical protein
LVSVSEGGKVMTSANYGIRPVTIPEIIKACGSARRALEITGGCEKLALFYIHNPEKIGTAGGVSERETGMRDALKVRARDDAYGARVDAAAIAYNSAGTLASIQAAVKCGHPMAQKLLLSAQNRGLIREMGK